MAYLSLPDVLADRASTSGRFVFLDDSGEPGESISFADLHQRAIAIAVELETRSLRNERALLLYPPGLKFIEAFFGCLYAGVIAVPAYPPRPNRPNNRIASILRDARPKAALTSETVLPVLDKATFGDLVIIVTSKAPTVPHSDWKPEAIRPDSIAFSQYTSGSTGNPKGVVVSHGNLLDNLERTRTAFGTSEGSVVVSWLPLYHDMGLIGNVLQPLYVGCTAILLSQHTFLRRPARWLEAITRYQGTISGAPNFAYDLCSRSVTTAQKEQLDLRSWEIAYCGAEPVNPRTLTAFASSFASCGFRERAFFPCYGLAEATLFVSGGPANRATIAAALDGAALESNRVLPGTGSAGDRIVASCGRAQLDVVIVHPETLRACPPDQVGEIWISGPSVAHGYWNKPEESEAIFRARSPDYAAGAFLRTGDLGFIRHGELFVTGRLKDLIIIRGRNRYPQDIEYTAERAHTGLRRGCCAAFGVPRETGDELTIVQEVDRHTKEFQSVLASIREAVIREHDIEPDKIVLIRTGTIPKTSSGKIQRSTTRAALTTGKLRIVSEWDRAGGAPRAKPPDVRRRPWPEKSAFSRWLQEQVTATTGAVQDAQLPGTPLDSLALDSMRAAELQSAIAAATGVQTPLTTLWSKLTIEGLTDQVWMDMPREIIRGPQPTETASLELLRPSHGQRALLFLCRLAPNSTAYHITRAVRFRVIDPPLLARALEIFVDRHPAFRTSFRLVDGDFQQRAYNRRDTVLNIIDAQSWTLRHVNADRQRRATTPFEFDDTPLFRADLYLRPKDEHVLQLVVHHVIADFWTLELLLQEVLGSYAALQNEAEIAEPSPCRWADFLAREKSLLDGPRGAQLRAYWKEKLSGPAPVLNIPLDRPRPAIRRFDGTRFIFDISRELSAAIRVMASDHKTSAFAVFVSAFAILLAKYSGQRDFVIGSPASNRTDAEFARSAGYFVNTLPLRIRIDPLECAEDVLRRTSTTILEALDHQELPFPLIVEETLSARNVGHSPAFDVMVAWLQPRFLNETARDLILGTDGPELQIHNTFLTPLDVPCSSAQFDLTLVVADGEEFRAAFEYSTDLFDEWRIRAMGRHLETILRSVVAEPKRKFEELKLLDKAERDQIVHGFNQTRADYAAAGRESLQAPFERHAAAHSDRVALVTDTRSVTYGELNAAANRLARWLRKQGATSERRVGVCLERSIDLFVALLGVLKSGAAYVPLDPGYPAERLAFMAEEADLRILVTTERLARLAPTGVRLVQLDLQAGAVSAESGRPLDVAIDPDALAYVIFTSGSTGRPKGVALAHRGVVNRLIWGERRLGFNENDRVLHKTPYSFDVSVWEMFTPLRVGARLVISRPGGHRDSRYLAELAADEGITVMHFVPSMLAPWLEERAIERCTKLRLLVCSGEALPGRLAERCMQRLPWAALHNLYGPTEASIEGTGWECRCEAYEQTGVPIGWPIENMKAHILDGTGEPVPSGIAGELCLGGAGLARGYIGRPELTAERFVPSRFSAGERLYRTGDQARYRPDGAIEFLGRLDNQVKIRGFRIELGEIEAALRQVKGVRDASAVVWDSPGGERQLVAYIIRDNEGIGEAESREAIRQTLARKLPAYMIPQHYVILERLPVNPNGKLDRRALPAPVIESDEYAAPRTALEQSLAEVFAAVLHLPRVSVDGNFFHLGGTSLLAIRVQSRINQMFEIDLPLSSIFESPTVELLTPAVAMAKTRSINPAELASLLDELDGKPEDAATAG